MTVFTNIKLIAKTEQGKRTSGPQRSASSRLRNDIPLFFYFLTKPS